MPVPERIRVPSALRERAAEMRRFLVNLAEENTSASAIAVDTKSRSLAHQVLAVDKGLVDLEPEDPVTADLAELAFFLGMSQREVCEKAGWDEDSIRADWSYASAWLRRCCAHATGT